MSLKQIANDSRLLLLFVYMACLIQNYEMNCGVGSSCLMLNLPVTLTAVCYYQKKKGVSDIRCSDKFRVGLLEALNIFFWVNAWLRYCIRRTPGNLSMESARLIDLYLACQKLRVV